MWAWLNAITWPLSTIWTALGENCYNHTTLPRATTYELYDFCPIIKC